MNYKEASDELRLIVEEIDTGEISIDDLSIKVRKAAELIKFCRNKLSETASDVSAILNELEDFDKENPKKDKN